MLANRTLFVHVSTEIRHSKMHALWVTTHNPPRRNMKHNDSLCANVTCNFHT